MNANMIRSDKAIYEIEWRMEDIFSNPQKLWYPKLKGFNYSSFGVYILWQPSVPRSKIIYAGKGIIKNRFSDHRRTEKIYKYESLRTPIYVAWAEVSKDLVAWIENYILMKLNPLETTNMRQTGNMAVNLPPFCLN